ncbi:hypothetical protein BC833DRAFT_600225 [Globomyces pollinis-pini]|nr:hypothetical protein BC833DRAFT_600225 [Globomyces pollinis-pini]
MERVEEILLDTVTVNPSYHQLQIVPNYLDSLQAETKIVETPDVRIRITDGNISWKLYKGSDWSTDPTSPSESSYSSSIGESQADDFAKHAYQVEIKLYKLEFEIELYPIDTLISKSILFRVRDIEIIDNIKTSQWNKFLTYRIPDHGAKPRETDSDMISFTMIGHRNNQIEEFQLRFSLLPIQLHIDQDTLLFMVGFFAKSDLLVSPDLARSISSNPTIPSKNDNTFFQQCKIDPISIQIDYKPKHVDYRSLKGGQVIEMINFLHLDGSKLYLKRIHVNGVQGWGRLVNRVMGIWLPHVRETQLSQLASGVPGVKSLVNLGTGIKDLVILPIEQFQKDGRLMRGLSKGTTSFLKATTMETVRLGSKLANGAQTILEQAEGMIKSKEMTDIPTQNISKLSDQPKDIVQGLQMGFQSLNQGVQRAFQTNQSTRIVPISALQPVIGLTEALAKTLVGIQNTLDHTQQSRMHNKYKSS